MGKNLKSSLLGILILVAGVIVGIILVNQTQSFKNSAKQNLEKEYTVCHKTGDSNMPWKEIDATADELPEYLNSGDIFGTCPDDLSQ